MKHHRGNQHFNNTWSSFRNGFHDNEAHEYYIGNQAFWYLSTLSHYILRFDMWSEDGTHICAEFGGVAVTQLPSVPDSRKRDWGRTLWLCSPGPGMSIRCSAARSARPTSR